MPSRAPGGTARRAFLADLPSSIRGNTDCAGPEENRVEVSRDPVIA